MFSSMTSIKKAKSHENLFHHTNYTTLFYILSDKTLRLSRLDRVCNDETEYTRLQADWWRQYYVSCFTYAKAEDDYFWQEYGNKDKPDETIRIKFANKFFDFGTPYYYIDGVKFEAHYMAENKWRNIRNRPTVESIDLKQILYSDELASLFGAVEYDNGLYHGAENHAGLVKYEKWQKEKECRLHMKIFNMLPINPFNDEDRLEHIEKTHNISIPVIKHHFNKQSIDIPYIYLPLPNILLDNIEVTFSYMMSNTLKRIIKEKVEELGYNSHVRFYDSSLKS